MSINNIQYGVKTCIFCLLNNKVDIKQRGPITQSLVFDEAISYVTNPEASHLICLNTRLDNSIKEIFSIINNMPCLTFNDDIKQ